MKQETKIIFGRGLLFLLMLLGLALALCSIASLSYINSDKGSNVPVVLRFDSAFRKSQEIAILSRNNILKLDTSITHMWEQYQSFSTSNSVASQQLSGDTREKFGLIADSLEGLLIKHLTLLSIQKNGYINLYNNYTQILRNEATRLDVEFKQQAVKLSPILLSKFAQDIISYFLQLPFENDIISNYNNLSRNYSQFFQALKITDSKLKFLAANLKNGKVSNQSNLSKFVSSIGLPIDAEYLIYKSGMPKYLKRPVPPKLGQDWGIFSAGITWLVGPNNLDILMLMGMLGFALFGAAITIYVTRNLQHPEVSISQSITLVFVRGFSAAIIVFLTMRGGIAILNSGESNPNPLVLFLFCFIGAVFSEPIWAWAQNKVVRTFPNDNNGAVDPNKTSNKKPDPEVTLKKPVLDESANKPELPKKPGE